MSCPIPWEVLEYIELVESGQYRACKEQIALVQYVRRVFETEDIFVDTARLEKYMGLAKYFPFELFPWEKFLFTLWNCTYTAPGRPRWKTVFAMIARGAGKDGYIAFDSFASVSPYNPVKDYDVDICANNEEQAMRPVLDVISVLETPKHESKLKKFFYHTKELVRGFLNHGIIKGRTNNPKGRDGMRSGKIIFNEVHAYLNYLNIKVFKTGLGKKAEPRIGIFTSNGDVSDGPLDDYISRAENILFEGHPDNGFLPFICRLNSKADVHDPKNWYMANPSLQYLPALYEETAEEYRDWLEHPEENGDFLTKRMGLRQGFAELAVTDYEKVKATNKALPCLSGWSCTVGVDYAEISDFASVNLHFKKGTERFDVSHSWLCLQSKNLHRIKAPWQDWAEKGLITPVDDVSINPDLLAEYVAEAMLQYQVKKLCMDGFRWTLVSEAFKKIGFDPADKEKVKLYRPSDIMQIEPVIQECFDRGYLAWGDNPVMRWAVNNTKRMRASKNVGSDTGNFYYAKIEAKSRKTDPFMAFVACMITENVLETAEPPELPLFGAFAI